MRLDNVEQALLSPNQFFFKRKQRDGGTITGAEIESLQPHPKKLTKKSHSLFSTLGTFKYTSSKLGIEALILSLFSNVSGASSRKFPPSISALIAGSTLLTSTC